MRGEFCRPDHVIQHDVIARGAGTLGRDDLVMQRFVGNELQIDLDAGIGFFEIGRHGTDVVFAVGGLFHEQGVQRDILGRCQARGEDAGQHRQSQSCDPS